MATKAERKEQARADREAREQERLAAERRKRLMWIGGAVVALIAVVAIVIAVASGGSNSSGQAGSAQAQSSVDKLLAGIPQSGNTLGNPSAPVTVSVFEDLECPVCKEFTLAAENQLIANQVRQGKAKLVFHSLQTATPDAPTFQFQQQAAMAAAKQNKLWHFVELFYHQQGQEGTPYVTQSYVNGLAKQIPGFDMNAWQMARNSPGVATAVSNDETLAHAKGFNSTPTIVVQGPKDSPAPTAGAIDYPTLSKLVAQAGG